MKKKVSLAVIKHKLASVMATTLCAILFVYANTNSCTMIHQPIAPQGLESYRRVK